MSIDHVPPVVVIIPVFFEDGALFAAWEDASSTFDPQTHLKVVDLGKVVCLEGHRACADSRSGDLPAICAGLLRMIQHETVAGKPDLLCGVMTVELKAGPDSGKTAGKYPAASQTSARAGHSGIFLEGCPNHGDPLFSEQRSLFPVHRMLENTHPRAAATSPLDDDEDEEEGGSVAGSSANVLGSKRGRAVDYSLSSLMEATDADCGAGGGSSRSPRTSSAPGKKLLKTHVSVPSQVRDTRNVVRCHPLCFPCLAPAISLEFRRPVQAL